MTVMPMPQASDKKAVALFVPVHLGEESLMFSKSDMEILKPFVEAYDNIHEEKNNSPVGDKDDLRSLMQQLKSNDASGADTKPPPLINLFLSSIIYYSPSEWSVWINDKKLDSAHNLPANEFYVSAVSRKEIVLVWRPQTLMDASVLWHQMTQNGKKPLQNIAVDSTRGIITLHMHTNQTFLADSLTLHEGLILPSPQALGDGNTQKQAEAPMPMPPPLANRMPAMPNGALPSVPTFSGEIHR